MRNKGKKTIEIVTPLCRTVKQPYTDWKSESIVPGWDNIPGVAQHASRVSRGHPPKADGTPNNPAVRSDHPKI